MGILTPIDYNSITCYYDKTFTMPVIFNQATQVNRNTSFSSFLTKKKNIKFVRNIAWNDVNPISPNVIAQPEDMIFISVINGGVNGVYLDFVARTTFIDV